MRESYVAIEYRTITKVSTMTGKPHTMTIGAPPEDWKNWARGMLIQKAFPEMSKEHREFLLSGITPEEWETLKGEDK
jgi:hypothetical protein